MEGLKYFYTQPPPPMTTKRQVRVVGVERERAGVRERDGDRQRNRDRKRERMRRASIGGLKMTVHK